MTSVCLVSLGKPRALKTIIFLTNSEIILFEPEISSLNQIVLSMYLIGI